MTRLATLIIADDLTGALDSVAPFAALGVDCLVATSLDALAQALAQGPQVLAINLGTRELDDRTARSRAGAAAKAMLQHVGPDTIWLKKIDSRMKGHVSAEVMALLAVTDLTRVLLCPAIPDLGRVVIGGWLQGAGVSAPVPVELNLPGEVDLARPDARSAAELDALVRAAAPGTLFVGARGLAGALARRSWPGGKEAMVPMPVGPVGFCIGSRDPITVEQVDRLTQTGSVMRVSAPDGVVAGRPRLADVLVVATPGKGATAEQVSSRLAEGMLGLIGGLTTVVASGGETAAALLRSAGVGVLRVDGEVLPGLPLCHAVEHPGFPVIITKSGGFGAPGTLLRLWQAARSKEGQPCL